MVKARCVPKYVILGWNNFDAF